MRRVRRGPVRRCGPGRVQRAGFGYPAGGADGDITAKISGCWRTLATLQRHCRTRSYLTTARSHGHHPLAAIRDALNGDVRASGHGADPRTSEEQAAGKAAARERREAYVRGHQLAEMRAAAGLTQAELANVLGVSQARVSKIEHGEISGIDVVRAYVAALGGSIDVVARIGDRSWKVA